MAEFGSWAAAVSSVPAHSSGRQHPVSLQDDPLSDESRGSAAGGFTGSLAGCRPSHTAGCLEVEVWETKHAERRATVRWADVWGPLLPGICPVTREKLPEETGAPRATRPPGHRTRTLTSPHPSLRCASFRSLGRGRGGAFLPWKLQSSRRGIGESPSVLLQAQRREGPRHPLRGDSGAFFRF